ncbi:thiamine biosynthesis lipoprotein [Psychromicrobium silvestre]|uniref:FAD:protein FMN transferase n=1 Tax=Psychromicrobium silvestre TaxID=1645614 RepID=A0A7Y9LUM7_9MICC|nr:FAD:protein FMN transferase [Psychromicrobium silvestre]NYE95896.1 thiamine biosynthesis lipoprotein [Psychromicrobium silvestre]
MGTVFSFDIRSPGVSTEALQKTIDWLHWVDAVFSTYRPDSQINRLDRGELVLAQCDPEVREVLELSAQAKVSTDGYFTVSIDHHLDPSGMVKGWAIERASEMLREAGSSAHAINGGGDIQFCGEAAPGRPWAVGIADPFRQNALAATVTVSDLAVATSSIAERGLHVINPLTGQPAKELASVTLIGARLSQVDAYATAALAMGNGAREWIEALDHIEGLTIGPAGETWQSTGFTKHSVNS